jgi:hypothetical protein
MWMKEALDTKEKMQNITAVNLPAKAKVYVELLAKRDSLEKALSVTEQNLEQLARELSY